MALSASAQTETAQHGLTAHSDGGWDFDAPVQTRSARFTSTDVNDFPNVTGREGNWKFTPVAELDALLNGSLTAVEQANSLAAPVAGIELDWIESTSPAIGRAGTPEDRASANAWGAFGRALHVRLDGEITETAVLERSNFDGTPQAAHTVIEALPHSRARLIVAHTGGAQLSENVEIVVGDGAHLTLVSVQQWDDDAVHLSSHFAKVGRDATLIHIVVSLGGKIVRVNPTIHLDSEGANGEALGAYFADAGQHLEHQVYLDHNAPHTRSRVNYKGALHGDGAHTVWIGDVLIRRSANGTDSYEQNRNLVLSEGTRADSIPNLEIETGDIEGAGHASATGRFDEEHLFYLRSRGISEDEARKLVVRGFLLEVIGKIGDADTEEQLQRAIESELEQSVFA